MESLTKKNDREMTDTAGLWYGGMCCALANRTRVELQFWVCLGSGDGIRKFTCLRSSWRSGIGPHTLIHVAKSKQVKWDLRKQCKINMFWARTYRYSVDLNYNIWYPVNLNFYLDDLLDELKRLNHSITSPGPGWAHNPCTAKTQIKVLDWELSLVGTTDQSRLCL